ncbi:tRNA modification GTPase GTPBP3 [Blattella germanica]|nr:tRNA modification GTPase GTPBP3 [Blattella germanica]
MFKVVHSISNLSKYCKGCIKLNIPGILKLPLILTSSHNLHRSYTTVSTIYALSSGYGKCGVAVIRVSGPKASEAIFQIVQRKSLPQPRQAALHYLKDPVTNDPLDRGLVLWFPGEFTKRAFHAGKLDLTEVEGLGDLIHAETEAQRKQAFFQMEGNLSKLYSTWREDLIKNMAHVEAYIDFSEDENIEDNVMEIVEYKISNLRNNIRNHLADDRCGERLRDGVRTVIVGEPNVGKRGYPVIIADTAGLRSDTQDLVEKEGISRAHAYAEKADLIILVIDAVKYMKEFMERGTSFDAFVSNYICLLDLDETMLYDKSMTVNRTDTHSNNMKCIVVLNKSDLVGDLQKVKNICDQFEGIVSLSCKTEEGIPQFLEKLTGKLKILCGNPSRENPCLTQSRHRQHLTDCLLCLEDYLKLSKDGNDIVLAAQELRKALRHIGKITGHVSTEQILDVIFKDFCIGK